MSIDSIIRTNVDSLLYKPTFPVEMSYSVCLMSVQVFKCIFNSYNAFISPINSINDGFGVQLEHLNIRQEVLSVF